MVIDRRRILAGLAALPIGGSFAHAQAERPLMRVYKDPNCGCCTAWAEKVKAAGFNVEIIEDPAIDILKTRLGVPQRLVSCHTATIAEYVIEGHVPPAEILRLIAERPSARGLAVPGMPLNSPGMETPGAPQEVYEVLLFGANGERSFARYAGSRRV